MNRTKFALSVIQEWYSYIRDGEEREIFQDTEGFEELYGPVDYSEEKAMEAVSKDVSRLFSKLKTLIEDGDFSVED